MSTDPRDFEDFLATDGVRLRRAMVARYGVDIGNDLSAEAMASVWADWTRVAAMSNPAGYAYRVAQSASRRHLRWHRSIVLPNENIEPPQEDATGDIFMSLGALKPLQRTCIVLIHAHRYSYQEVADLLGISTAAITNHVHRGMKRLRADLGETP